MNLFTISLAGLRDARLTHALNILILAMGIATVTLLLLFSGTATDGCCATDAASIWWWAPRAARCNWYSPPCSKPIFHREHRP